MEQAVEHIERIEVTATLARHASAMRFEDLPEAVVTVAKQCLLDWLGVAIAGAGEPLTRMLREQAVEDGGAAQATLIGRGGRVAAPQAALVNGAAGHALDFDDVLSAMGGHPTAPVLPAALALAERDGHDGRRLLAAFVAGVETKARIGLMMSKGSSDRGFHNTGTFGGFGAAAACANLFGLDDERTAAAFGIAGTQAAGLKSMFGTMCKPLHAGKAAQNGLLAASLARRGFSSRADVLDCAQGFAATQADAVDPEAATADMARWHLPDVLFKYHPACYGTHASIEAARRIVEHPGFTADKVEQAEVLVDPRYFAICNIQEPTTGLEGKFSLRYNVGLALADRATGALASYEDDAVTAPPVVALRDRVRVKGTEGLDRHAAEVVVHLRDGLVLRERADVGVPERDLDRQGAKLATKFRALAEPLLGKERTEEALAIVAAFEGEADVRRLMRTCSVG